jgi:integrase
MALLLIPGDNRGVAGARAELANPAYLSRILHSALPCVALYCVPGGVRVVSIQHRCFTILLARGTHPKYVQHLAGHASVQLTLDRYSHWIPSMGRNTAERMDGALG